MNGISMWMTVLLFGAPATENVTVALSPAVPTYLQRREELSEVTRLLRFVTQDYIQSTDPEMEGEPVRLKYPNVREGQFGRPDALGTELRTGTMVVFTPGKALTAAHLIVGEGNRIVLDGAAFATCSRHPCYLPDHPVTRTGKRWDIALCKGDASSLVPSDIQELSFDFVPAAGQAVSVVGFGCTLDGQECPATEAELISFLLRASGRSSPSLARLYVSGDLPETPTSLHESIVQVRSGDDRCTVVCNGDSGGAVFFPANSHTVVGITSKFDRAGESYFTLLDDVTKSWLASLEPNGPPFDSEALCLPPTN